MKRASPAPASDRLPEYALESRLPFLLNAAGVGIGEAFSAFIAGAGLTLPDWRILVSLADLDGQTVSELAARTGLEMSRVSRLVSAATTKGWVRRQASDRDGRETRILLAAAGRRLVAGALPTALLYERVALAGIDAKEAALLKDLLSRIHANLASLRPVRTRARQREKRGSASTARATPRR